MLPNYCNKKKNSILDLSLVSKRFGFWPHITHVIVLPFKEIKHLSDYRTTGQSDCRTIRLLYYRSDPMRYTTRG